MAVDEKRFLAERVDVGAVLLVELSHDVVQVHQVVAVAPGLLVVEHHEVVAGFGLDLGGLLGGELYVGNMVRAGPDVRLPGELLQELLELGVRLRHEVAPAKHGHFALLGDGGRDAEGKYPR